MQATVKYPNRVKYTWKSLRVPAVRGALKMVVVDITPRGARKKKAPGKLHAAVAWPEEQQYEEALLRAAWQGNPVSGDKLHQLLRKQYLGLSRERVAAWVKARPPPAKDPTKDPGKDIQAGGSEGGEPRAVAPTAPHQHQAIHLQLLHKRTHEAAASPFVDVSDYYTVLVVVDAFSKFAWMRLLHNNVELHNTQRLIDLVPSSKTNWSQLEILQQHEQHGHLLLDGRIVSVELLMLLDRTLWLLYLEAFALREVLLAFLREFYLLR